MKKIIFVCKNNIFRSKIAEAVFNKLNKNKNYSASSGGIILNVLPHARTVANLKKIGITISGKSKSLTRKVLNESDYIVIVANDVPPNIFDEWKGKKVIVWKIKDTDAGNAKEIQRIGKEIEGKVKKFVEGLK